MSFSRKFSKITWNRNFWGFTVRKYKNFAIRRSNLKCHKKRNLESCNFKEIWTKTLVKFLDFHEFYVKPTSKMLFNVIFTNLTWNLLQKKLFNVIFMNFKWNQLQKKLYNVIFTNFTWNQLQKSCSTLFSRILREINFKKVVWRYFYEFYVKPTSKKVVQRYFHEFYVKPTFFSK